MGLHYKPCVCASSNCHAISSEVLLSSLRPFAVQIENLLKFIREISIKLLFRAMPDLFFNLGIVTTFIYF